MFAKSSTYENYHLLDPDEEHTLCGRPVAPVIIDRPVDVSGLHLTKSQPPGTKLCDSCAARAERRQEAC